MLRTTAIAKELAAIERKMQETDNATLKEALKKKQARLKAELKDPKQSTTQLAKTLLAQREVVKQLSKVEFNDLIRRLSKKPEYAFLKSMPKSTVRTDLERTAKPVGWRFKGRGNYDKPTKAEIIKGKKNGTVYREVRPRRSDVSQVVKLAEGGGVDSVEPTGYKQNDAVEYGKKLIDAGVKYSVVRSKIEEHYAGLRGEIQDVMNKVLDYKESKMSDGGSMHAEGGEIEKESIEMVKSQTKEVKHHAIELSNALKSKKNIEPWVIAKMERASTDLSDITHYLEGQEQKMEQGGQIGSTITFRNFQGDIREGQIIDVLGNRGYEVRSGFGTALVKPDEIISFGSKMAKGGSIEVGDTIRLKNDLPYMASLSSLMGKDLEVVDVKEVYFASGPKKFYHVVVDGDKHEVREDFIEHSDKMAKGGCMYADGGSIEVGDDVSYTRKFTGVKTKGKVIEIDEDEKYVKVRNSVGNIDYISASEIKKMSKGGSMYAEGGSIEVGDKVKATKEYGGKSGKVVEKRGSFVVVEDSKGNTESYHESDLIKKMAQGGEVSYTDYKGESIMFEPHFKEYYVGDAGPFNTLDEAKEYIDGGSQMPDSIKEAYRKGLFAKGGQLTAVQQKKFDKVMHEWGQGKLHSGKNGPIVKDQDQAVAIAYAEARGMKKMAKGGGVDENIIIGNLEVKNHEYPLMSWVNANKRFSSLKSGWRLPTKEEFEKILLPKMNSINVKTDDKIHGYDGINYWSSTTETTGEKRSSVAYSFVFRDKKGYFSHKDNKANIILVRDIKPKMAKGGSMGWKHKMK